MEVFLFMLPNFFKVTIPMAVLVGVLLGLSRLAADSEIIAMRASGLGIGYFVRVASIVAVGGTLLGLANSSMWRRAPTRPSWRWTGAGLAGLLRDSAARLLRGLQELRPLRAGRALRNRRGQLAPGLHGRRHRSRQPKITTAASATVPTTPSQELLMRLRNGTEHDPVAGQPQQYNISTFRHHRCPWL
jgi:hypothetical protein